MAGITMTERDHARIAEAIRTAEASTAGEIYCVVAHSSDGYFFSAAMVVTRLDPGHQPRPSLS